jgi:hypothetical protein
VRRALERASDPEALGAMWSAGVYSGDPAGAADLARALWESGRAPEVRALAGVTLAYLLAARGRWDDARRQLDAVAPFRDDIAAFHGYLAALPFAPTDPELLRAERSRLHAWAPTTRPGERWLPLYLGALLDARMGDPAAALRGAAALEEPGPRADGSGADRARGVRAYTALLQGRPEEALRELDAMERPPRLIEAAETPAAGGSLDRFVRAEALHALGRGREALGWYGSFEGVSSFDLVFRVPAAAARARILVQTPREGGDAPQRPRTR